MTRLILAFAMWISILAPSAFAQENTNKRFVIQQQCDNVEAVMQTIVRYGEKPLFQTQTLTQHVSGEWFEGSSMFFVNQESGTYSMVTLYPDNTACIQAAGTGFEPYVSPGLTAGR